MGDCDGLAEFGAGIVWDACVGGPWPGNKFGCIEPPAFVIVIGCCTVATNIIARKNLSVFFFKSKDV